MPEPRVLVRKTTSLREGRAIYEQLGYAGSIYRVTRLTMVNGPHSYEIYGTWFPEAHVMRVAKQVPPASRDLNGVKATVGLAEFSHCWHLRIDNPGDSLMEAGEVYATFDLGRESVQAPRTEFQEHAALAAYSQERQRPAFLM